MVFTVCVYVNKYRFRVCRDTDSLMEKTLLRACIDKYSLLGVKTKIAYNYYGFLDSVWTRVDRSLY